MDLKIPLETRRFHPDVIEELIGRGFFDDVDKMDDKMYMVHNPEYRIINHTVKTIGMWMSGGADSSLCAWMLCIFVAIFLFKYCILTTESNIL